jgi:HlyD family secretion protein
MEQQKQKSFKLSKQWLVMALVLIFAGAIGLLLLRDRFTGSSKTIEVSALTVKKDTVEDKISGERGILELVGQRQLKSPTEGTVEKVAVEVGDRVKAGQILILLRDPERKTKLREHQYQLQEQQLDLSYKQQEATKAETDLTQAKQELQRELNNFHNVRQTEILKKQAEIQKQELNLAQKRLQIEEAQSQLAEAQQQLQADEKLFARGFIAEDQLQEQRKTVRSDRLNLSNTQLEARQLAIDLDRSRLDLKNIQQELQNQTSDTQDKLRQAEEAVSDAESKLRQAKSEVSKASIALEKLQLERRKIEEELQKNTIVSPINAMVLDLPVRKGDVVKLGDNLLTIGDDSQQVIKLKISTLNAAKVKPNQLARVSVIGPEAKTFTGKVERVSLLATMEQEGNSQNQAKVSATVKLDPQSDRLIPGSPVNVDIILERRQDVVAIDTEAVQQSDLEPFVWVLDGQGKAQKRNVALGLEGLTNVEITSGLRPGDKVLLPPPDTELKSGMLVRVK